VAFVSEATPNQEEFRLLAITATGTPSGCVGPGWFVYRIAQGENVMTGYRCGDLQSVSAEVAAIVTGLNARRGLVKSKPGPKPGRRRQTAAAATTTAADEDPG
jgi:hypothetical protein